MKSRYQSPSKRFFPSLRVMSYYKHLKTLKHIKVPIKDSDQPGHLSTLHCVHEQALGPKLSRKDCIFARPDDTSSRSLAFRPLHHG